MTISPSLMRVSDFLLFYDAYIYTNLTPDTIAGQMAALKGQTTSDPAAKEERAKRRAARRAAHDAEESDYESGTDEDEDSESETDTDTDTDEE
jgi:translocation protein SEC63